MQEPDTKLTWMNYWNDVGVEDHSEVETRFCYFHQHSCVNFQSVTLEKVYPISAIKKQRSSWFMDPTRNLYPWLVFTVTIKRVYSVMARLSILSTCFLVEQGMHCRKNNMIIPYPNLEIISSFTSVLTIILVPFIPIQQSKFPNQSIACSKKPHPPGQKRGFQEHTVRVSK